MSCSVSVQHLRAGFALLLCTGVACSDNEQSTRTGPPPPPPAVRSIRIEPSNFALTVGASLQLRAVVDAEPGANAAVRWSATPSETATITESGLLRTCYPPAVVTVVARSLADSTKAASTDIPVLISLVGWAFVGGIVRPGDGSPPGSDYLDRNALQGDVDFYVVLNPSDFIPCRLIERVEVWVRGTGVDTTIASIAFQPPFATARSVRARFATRSVKNGAYRVGGRMFLTGLTQPTGIIDEGIVVANP